MSRSATPNRHDTIAREAYDRQWRTSQFATRARLPRATERCRHVRCFGIRQSHPPAAPGAKMEDLNDSLHHSNLSLPTARLSKPIGAGPSDERRQEEHSRHRQPVSCAEMCAVKARTAP